MSQIDDEGIFRENEQANEGVHRHIEVQIHDQVAEKCSPQEYRVSEFTYHWLVPVELVFLPFDCLGQVGSTYCIV